MKYIKTYEKFDTPTPEELKDYDIKVGDHVKINNLHTYQGPWFIEELIEIDIGEVDSIFWSNKGYQNQSIECDVLYKDIPEHISKRISGKPKDFKMPITIEELTKVTDEEYENYLMKKATEKYNL